MYILHVHVHVPLYTCVYVYMYLQHVFVLFASLNNSFNAGSTVHLHIVISCHVHVHVHTVHCLYILFYDKQTSMVQLAHSQTPVLHVYSILGRSCIFIITHVHVQCTLNCPDAWCSTPSGLPWMYDVWTCAVYSMPVCLYHMYKLDVHYCCSQLIPGLPI